MNLDPAALSQVLGTMQKAGPDSTIRQQAEQIWQMLDNMHQSNPDEYAAFVKQQVEQGPPDAPLGAKGSAELGATPRPALILTTAILRQTDDNAAAGRVDLANIVQQGGGRQADVAVVSLFECSKVASAPRTQAEAWDPARHRAADVQPDSVCFEVRRSPSVWSVVCDEWQWHRAFLH